MTEGLSTSLTNCHGLAPTDLADARELLRRCNLLDRIDLALNLAPEGGPDSAELSQYLWRENGALVGLLTIDGVTDVEVTLGADPARRRHGIGRRLLDAARADCARRGLKRWTLTLDEASPSGRAFVLAVGGVYRSSEYRLELIRDRVPPPRVWDPAIVLRRADPSEAELVGRLEADSFGDPRDETARWVRRDLAKSNHRFDIALLATEPIGAIRTNYYDDVIYVTAFGVLPEYRGRGYGRQMLEATIRRLIAENWPTIRIEVETDNRNALGLYQSSGFELKTEYGYYEQGIG